MTPYYTDALTTLYHGDAREVFAHLPKCGAVVTDPPYGIDGGAGHNTRAARKSNYGGQFEDTRENVERVIIPLLFDVMKWDCMALTPGAKNLDLYPQADSFGVFYSRSASGMQRFGFADSSPILFYGTHHLQGKRPEACCMEMKGPAPRNGHPCPKPANAWAWLLLKTAEPGALIYDPFCGSGTTLAIARDHGFASVGCEINESFCEITARRLSQQVIEI